MAQVFEYPIVESNKRLRGLGGKSCLIALLAVPHNQVNKMFAETYRYVRTVSEGSWAYK